MRVYPERIVTSYRLNDPVPRLLGLVDEGTEHSVPNYQNSGVVPVEVWIIYTVMDAMMRRRVEYILEDTHSVDESSVDPELVDQIEAMRDCEHPRSESEKHDGCIKNPVDRSREPTLPNCNAQVELLTRMMDDVKIPEETRLVAYSMKPVVSEIVDKE